MAIFKQFTFTELFRHRFCFFCAMFSNSGHSVPFKFTYITAIATRTLDFIINMVPLVMRNFSFDTTIK